MGPTGPKLPTRGTAEVMTRYAEKRGGKKFAGIKGYKALWTK